VVERENLLKSGSFRLKRAARVFRRLGTRRRGRRVLFFSASIVRGATELIMISDEMSLPRETRADERSPGASPPAARRPPPAARRPLAARR
jgi:hypothetical protein